MILATGASNSGPTADYVQATGNTMSMMDSPSRQPATVAVCDVRP